MRRGAGLGFGVASLMMRGFDCQAKGALERSHRFMQPNASVAALVPASTATRSPRN